MNTEPENEIVNRVASSGLVTFDLEQYYQQGERIAIDLKDHLFQGLILREKDFREFIRSHDWAAYRDKFVAVHCSADAIIPTWAYMLVASALSPFARKVVLGSLDDLEAKIFSDALAKIDWKQFDNAKVVVKGCSKVAVPPAVYVETTALLRQHAASIMFGEPCSTVPVYKRPKTN